MPTLQIRTKVLILDAFDLKKILSEGFLKIGLSLDLVSEEADIIANEVRKYQGNLYADTLADLFSKFAGNKLLNQSFLTPTLSAYFITQLCEKYFATLRNIQGKKEDEFKPNGSAKVLTNQDHFKNFMQHCLLYKHIPENPDWTAILKYLEKSKYFRFDFNFDTIPKEEQLEIAKKYVKEWLAKMHPDVEQS